MSWTPNLRIRSPPLYPIELRAQPLGHRIQALGSRQHYFLYLTQSPSRFCLNLRFKCKIEDPRKFNHIADVIIYGTTTGYSNVTSIADSRDRYLPQTHSHHTTRMCARAHAGRGQIARCLWPLVIFTEDWYPARWSIIPGECSMSTKCIISTNILRVRVTRVCFVPLCSHLHKN